MYSHTLIEENAEISALYSALIGNFKDNLVDVGVRLLGGEQVGAHNISTIMASGKVKFPSYAGAIH